MHQPSLLNQQDFILEFTKLVDIEFHDEAFESLWEAFKDYQFKYQELETNLVREFVSTYIGSEVKN